MLYIVGYWHLFEYTDAFPAWRNSLTGILTVVAMAIFVLISGFLNGKPTPSNTAPRRFYVRRLTRIYPLYAIAVIVYYFLGMNGGLTSIKSLIVISPFWGPSPFTLWFIAMILVFYGVTPLLTRFADSPLAFLLISGAIFAVVFGLEAFSSYMDRRLIYYFPCYCAGIYFARNGFSPRYVVIPSIVTLLILWALLSASDLESWLFRQVMSTSLALSSAALIFALCYRNERRFVKSRVISILSYSSFTMYLFHRPIYLTIVAVWFPESGFGQLVFLVGVCLPVGIAVSWIIQRAYDSILKSVSLPVGRH